MKETQIVNADIKNLASKFGLRYDVEDTADEIIFALTEEIEAQIDESEENPKELSILMSYMHRLENLSDRLNELREIEGMFESTNIIDAKRFQQI